MPIKTDYPTPYPEVNTILEELLESLRPILGKHLVGLYLEGSLTGGDFDPASDIDFVAVTDEEISANLFLALQSMHQRISTMDSPYAIHLEGSYIPRGALRRHDPQKMRHPNIERGSDERLKWVDHDESWNIHRYLLRERGITILGPAPRTLIAPISPNDLRQAMLPALQWAVQLLDQPGEIKSGAYQAYIVLSLCRILYTLQWGDIVSKRAAAQWAQENLDGKWVPLIEQAWLRRQSPPAKLGNVGETLNFIRYALERSQQPRIS
jgi:hypothetical protein